MFANERRCKEERSHREAIAMNATYWIIGGDPMLDMDKSLEAIAQLKAAFGKSHIHLYNSVPFDPSTVSKFADAGLDEIPSTF